MSNCLLTQGFPRDCRDSMGGIKAVYIANLSNIDSMTETEGLVDAITMETGSNFFKYELRKQTSSTTETIEASDENGTVFYEQEVNIQLTRMETAKRNEIALIARAEVVLIAEDQNGKFWLFGKENGLTLGGTITSGTAFGDLNGYELTLTGQEKESAIEVDDTAIDGLLEEAV